MIHLVSYDIEDDRIRTKLSKLLIAAGYERIQLSVFVGPHDPVSNTELWKGLKALCNTGDSAAQLIVIKIPKQQFLLMQTLGNVSLDLPYLVGDLLTLII